MNRTPNTKKTLSVKLENCFGIASFKHTFSFDAKNRVKLIYASNGTMKSSFAKIFESIANGQDKSEMRDRLLDSSATSTCEILYDTIEIQSENIIVSNSNTERKMQDHITTFLASQNPKNQYEAIYKKLDTKKQALLSQIRKHSACTNCEGEIRKIFKIDDGIDFFVWLSNLRQELEKGYPLRDIKYHDLFDKANKVEKFLKDNKVSLLDYQKTYAELLNQSEFYKQLPNGVNFGTYQANQLCYVLRDNSFFEAGHSLKLNGKHVITSIEELKDLIEQERSRILNSPELKDKFNSIDELINKNADLRAFKEAIQNQKEILSELSNYTSFQKSVWYGYFQREEQLLQDFAEEYTSHIDKLDEIASEANKEVDTWKKVIDLFKHRFDVPFTIELTNKTNLVYKKEVAQLCFKYKDSKGHYINRNKDTIMQVLSNGEKRAFYLLQLLFEIETCYKKSGPHFLILDDIAESYDYKNKYAIIEYLYDLSRKDDFRMIILTHNFDFYRLVVSRLDRKHVEFFMATKDKKGKVELHQGEYTQNLFQNLRNDKATDISKFIALIPFVRNLIECTQDKQSEDYLTLTSCLHRKEESTRISVQDIIRLMQRENYLKENFTLKSGDKTENIIEFIIHQANELVETENINAIRIENKIVLAIASRLTAEQFMINHLGVDVLSTISKNQTAALYEIYKEKFENTEETKILTQMMIITPEHIHINSFMYEALIDTPVHRLVELYKAIKDKLNKPPTMNTGIIIPHNSAIADHVKQQLEELYVAVLIPAAEITRLQDKDYCKRTFNINYPLLIDLRQSRKDEKGHARYWQKWQLDNTYQVCCMWFEYSRELFDAWCQKMKTSTPN